MNKSQRTFRTILNKESKKVYHDFGIINQQPKSKIDDKQSDSSFAKNTL